MANRFDYLIFGLPDVGMKELEEVKNWQGAALQVNCPSGVRQTTRLIFISAGFIGKYMKDSKTDIIGFIAKDDLVFWENPN